MQRVRIGLTGLAGVFLLVLAAAAFFGLARREPDAVAPGTPAIVGLGKIARDQHLPAIAALGNLANVVAPKEPLAELGVTPGNLPEAPSAVLKAPPAGAATPRH